MNLRLLGARTLKEVVPEMVDASGIHNHSVSVPSDRLYEGNCMCCRLHSISRQSSIYLRVGTQMRGLGRRSSEKER
jgi:hypothetical protein